MSGAGRHEAQQRVRNGPNQAQVKNTPSTHQSGRPVLTGVSLIQRIDLLAVSPVDIGGKRRKKLGGFPSWTPDHQCTPRHARHGHRFAGACDRQSDGGWWSSARGRDKGGRGGAGHAVGGRWRAREVRGRWEGRTLSKNYRPPGRRLAVADHPCFPIELRSHDQAMNDHMFAGAAPRWAHLIWRRRLHLRSLICGCCGGEGGGA